MNREEAKASGKGTHETHACVCISKQAVLDIVDSYSESRSNVEDVIQDTISDILALPPVTPQPKTGYWIGIDGKPSHLQDGMTTGSAWCLECGKWLTASDEYSCFGKFCPNCGARMFEPQERSDKA